ncbi:MAG: queuosine precursor transporter [Bifidobacteriaceae bacterium]|nr:queuosine precursor transporter [Bifidobacteriaceae bacterium]
MPDTPSRLAAAGTPLSWYGTLVGAFAALLVVSNIAAVKLIGLGRLELFGTGIDITVDGGALLFPLTYVLGDVLAEVFGFKAARRAIWVGFVCAALAVGSFWLVGVAPPAANWLGQGAFTQTLGFVPRVVAASLAGYLAGQLSNAFTLTAMKRRADTALWRRLLGSTLVGELADTAVFCTVAFYGVITGPQFFGYAALGYIYKCLAEVVLLPITYGVIRATRRHEARL